MVWAQQGTVRAITAWILLISHLTAISVSLFLVDFKDALGLIMIMCPLTGSFVLIVVQHYAEALEQSDSGTKLLNPNAAFMTVFLTSVLSILIIWMQYLFWLGKIPDLETLKTAVGSVDTVVGGYTAILIKKLFAS